MKLTKPIFNIVTILLSFSLLGQEIQISGTVEEESSGEAIPNISIVWESSSGKKFSSTNSYGFYSISVSEGPGRLIFSSFGFKTQTKQYRNLNKNIVLNISLKDLSTELNEVSVTSEKLNDNITTTEMSVSKLSAKEIKKVPQLLGETDVIRTLTLLPGVSTVGEGASGFNVRGGNADQNLIILD
jgi:hypothetical protein